MESHKVFLFLLTLFPSLLSATSDINTVGELDALQSQITWYKALAARNKAKDEVGLTGSLDRSPTMSIKPDPIPRITKMIGHGKSLYVRLRFPDGTEMTRKKGDAIPGGFTLTQVSLDEVTITHFSGNKMMLTEATP
ncbi:MAG: hypothetical protein HamCj_06640 [Candidatus Hamiltonella defensa (Ceratovacuna japonica)]